MAADDADAQLARLAVVACLAVAGGLLPPPARAQETHVRAREAPVRAQETPAPFAVTNARVFHGALAVEGETVLVRDGLIVAVGRDVAVPDGIEVIDGTGQTLLPGLIDAHTHAIYVSSLRQALVLGVTAELDMFTSHRQAASIQEAQAEGGGLDLADLFSAGTLVTAPGGHGTEYGLPIPTIRGPEEAPAFVDARIREGSDYIKVVYGDPARRPTIDRATLEAVVEAAHERGKLAVVHVETLEGAREAVAAEADGLAHAFADREPDAAFLRLARERGAFVVSTLTMLEAAAGISGGAGVADDPRLSPYLSPEASANLRRAASRPASPPGGSPFAVALAAVGALERAGVPILAGTDAPNPGTAHGASLHRELELLVEAGLSPLEALAAATSAPARAFRLEGRGRIAPGKRADLLLVRGDPTTDIRATRDIVRVWKLGVPVDREAYREEVTPAWDEARGPVAPGLRVPSRGPVEPLLGISSAGPGPRHPAPGAPPPRRDAPGR